MKEVILERMMPRMVFVVAAMKEVKTFFASSFGVVEIDSSKKMLMKWWPLCQRNIEQNKTCLRLS